MKSKTDMLWLISGGLITMLLIWLLFQRQQDHYNWTETYYISDDEPFCNSVLLTLAETYFPEKQFTVVKQNIYHVLDTLSTAGHKNYFFAGNTFFMDDSILPKFLSFIYDGNDAFIAARSFPDEVAEEFFGSVFYLPTDTGASAKHKNNTYYTRGDYFDEDNYTLDKNIITRLAAQNINLNFTDENFSTVNGYAYSYSEKGDPLTYNWKYFTEDFIQKEGKNYSIQPLGKVTSGGYNFILLEHGKGKIYIFSTPLLLTNLYLIEKENLAYTSKLLSHLTPGDMIWDEYSKKRHGENYTPPDDGGPLQFILSQQSLRWAWYLLLTGLLIFILFRGKRLQQPIPVTEPNINKSLEFAQTIGRLHYVSRDNKHLLQQKMKLLLHQIKDRYRIPVQEINEVFYHKLSQYAQLPEKDIKNIFSTYTYLAAQHKISDHDVIDFHNMLDSYYKNCK